MKKIFIALVSFLTIALSSYNTHATDLCKGYKYDKSDWSFNSPKARKKLLFNQQIRGDSPYASKVLDEYTNDIIDITDADADHVIPIKWMFDNGGCRWSPSRKKAFANDIGNLKFTHKSLNRAKGSKGPNGWLPPGDKAKTRYLKIWSSAANKYNVKSFPFKRIKFANQALLKNGGRVIKFGGRVFIVIGVASTAYEIYEIQKDPAGYWRSLKSSASGFIQGDTSKISNYERRVIELRNR